MRKTRISVLLISAGTVLAACGGSTHGPSMGSMTNSRGAEKNAPVVPGAREVTVASDAYTFTPKRIQIGSGEDVTIALTATDIHTTSPSRAWAMSLMLNAARPRKAA